ncbi:histidinol dehydrogenase [Lactococcus cremoris]|uniref:Histidinol dehydrogenase n=1 Tax=Lactococcus cremoris subsp. tructae TaxID=542833 RepID=A0A2A5SPJ5_LACLC|nr:histidinol dehydrogenase [Lactococcus cremoris]PCS15862.1 Histidinol dehydrogenase [Lactococcus cremoris subsp. tructae]
MTLLNKIAFTADLAEKFQGRKASVSKEVSDSVEKIIDNIRQKGDTALFAYAKEFDGADLNASNLTVTPAEFDEGLAQVDADYIRILERTKAQIEEYHAHQLESSWMMPKSDGTILGAIVRPLERVALYVPGGTAAYPSTVMMNAVPAKLAGVPELVIITPVKSDGKVNPVILAAAKVAGVDTIYKVGGAQGVAAVAYGTPSIKKVDKIVGPGNIFVATAKKLCYGTVDIDMIAGPSEVLVIADEAANPKYVAADLMAQAEHDKLASAILVTTSDALVDKVNAELDRQVQYLERREIIESAIPNYGGAIVVSNLTEAFDVSNDLAPEHLEILTENPLEKLPLVKNAGSIFLGEYTPEPLGDYMSGTNHVLPTGGTAKFYSALGVYDFVKHSAYSYYPKAVLETFKDDVQKFAKSEGLTGHANSIAVRFDEEEK